MKKFISWVSAVAVFVSVVSCREAEELPALSETNYYGAAKLKEDSVKTKTETSSSEGSHNVSGTEEGDPPKKDEIKW